MLLRYIQNNAVKYKNKKSFFKMKQKYFFFKFRTVEVAFGHIVQIGKTKMVQPGKLPIETDQIRPVGWYFYNSV